MNKKLINFSVLMNQVGAQGDLVPRVQFFFFLVIIYFIFVVGLPIQNLKPTSPQSAQLA